MSGGSRCTADRLDAKRQTRRHLSSTSSRMGRWSSLRLQHGQTGHAGGRNGERPAQRRRRCTRRVRAQARLPRGPPPAIASREESRYTPACQTCLGAPMQAGPFTSILRTLVSRPYVLSAGSAPTPSRGRASSAAACPSSGCRTPTSSAMARRPRTRAAEGLLAGPSRGRRCTPASYAGRARRPA